jgi:hypothetical protein
MSDSAALWPLPSDIIAATLPRTVAPCHPCALRPDTVAEGALLPRAAAPASSPASRSSRLFPPRSITGTPPTISHMFFPSGAGCLKIPYGLEPRSSSTALLCRLRATKTLFR